MDVRSARRRAIRVATVRERVLSCDPKERQDEGATSGERQKRAARRPGRFAGACVGLMAVAALATSYTWTDGNSNHDYWDSGNWSPSGIPDCCDDEATIVHLSASQTVTTTVDLTDDLDAKAISELTISSSDDEDGQTVEFLDGDSSDPELKTEVLIFDASGLDYDLLVTIQDEAMIKTLGTCICTP